MNQEKGRYAYATLVRGLMSLVVGLSVYQIVSQSGAFAKALMPEVLVILSTLSDMGLDGTMFSHAGHTLLRVLIGWALAIAVALPLGVLMARNKGVEDFFMPLVSVFMPIPSLAWVPIFILWFGLGDTTTILVVFYAACFPMVLNTWTGVRSVSSLWIRAGQSLGASSRQLFWFVIIPGASTFIISGVRQSFQRAWIAVIGAEMIAASDWGLGWVIFDSKEWLSTDVILASLLVIGIIGYIFEKFVLTKIEKHTVVKWGMLKKQTEAS
jgi:NitT/TauT family transport system permease protein